MDIQHHVTVSPSGSREIVRMPVLVTRKGIVVFHFLGRSRYDDAAPRWSDIIIGSPALDSIGESLGQDGNGGWDLRYEFRL